MCTVSKYGFLNVFTVWKSIAWSNSGKYRKTDQYVNGPFIIQLMHVGFTCKTEREGT